MEVGMVELADQVPTVIEAAEAGLEIGYGLYAVCASDGVEWVAALVRQREGGACYVVPGHAPFGDLGWAATRSVVRGVLPPGAGFGAATPRAAELNVLVVDVPGDFDSVRQLTFETLAEEMDPDAMFAQEGYLPIAEDVRRCFEGWLEGEAGPVRDFASAHDEDDGVEIVSAAGAAEAPPAAGGPGRGRGRQRGGGGAAAGRGPVRAEAARSGSRMTVRDLAEMLQRDLGGIRSRLEALEEGRGAAGAPPGLAAPSSRPGLFGHAGAPGVEADAALAQARQLLGVGDPSGPAGSGDPAPGADALRRRLGFGGPAAASAGRAGPADFGGATPRPSAPRAAARAGPDEGGGPSRELAAAMNALAAAVVNRGGGSRGSVEEAFGLNTAVASTEEEYNSLWNGDLAGSGAAGLRGAGALDRIRRTRESRPEVVIVAHEKTAREVLQVLPGEAWSWSRHATAEVLPYCKTFKTLRRVIVAVAAGLDVGRTRGAEHQSAYFHHLYRVLENAAKDPEHDLSWSLPILGITDPDDPRPRAGWAAAEASALASFHKEQYALEQVRAAYRQRGKGHGGSSASEEKPAAGEKPGWKPSSGRGDWGRRGGGKEAGRGGQAAGSGGPAAGGAAA